MRKPWIAEILKRWLLVAKMVPYKFPNDIPLKLWTLRVLNGQFIFGPKHLKAYSSDTVNHRNSQKVAFGS